MRDHGHGGCHLAAGCRRAGELTGLLLMRAYHEAAWRVRASAQGHHPRLLARDQPGLGHIERL